MGLVFKYSNNWEKVKNELQLLHGKKDTVVTTVLIRSIAPFAGALQGRKGYYIFNDSLLQAEVISIFDKKRRSTLNITRVEKMAEEAVLVYIEKLRSYTGGTKTAFRKGMGSRGMHPGGWADITGYLNNSYEYRINSGQWKADPQWKAGLAEAQAKFAEIYPNARSRT
tara:strand:- start:601 stop:1104 length:504 start_codon:yes stop_codon:yes gene_type:complete